jgi:pyruvate carboxylase
VNLFCTMKNNRIPYLFVYGTLKKEFDNTGTQLLKKYANLVATGKINAVLYQVADYPGSVISQKPSAWVEGEVYLLNQQEAILTMLDEYEGFAPNDPIHSEFIRSTIPIYLSDGGCLTGWVYLFNRPVSNLIRLTKFVNIGSNPSKSNLS